MKLSADSFYFACEYAVELSHFSEAVQRLLSETRKFLDLDKLVQKCSHFLQKTLFCMYNTT